MTSALVTQWEVGKHDQCFGDTVGSGKHDQCFSDTVGSGKHDQCFGDSGKWET